MRDETIQKCLRVKKAVESGTPRYRAMEAEQLGAVSWDKFKKLKAGKDYDEAALMAAPQIQVHNLGEVEKSVRPYNKKNKFTPSARCVVVVTEAANLRSVLEGLF